MSLSILLRWTNILKIFHMIMYIISPISILWHVQDVDESIFMQMTVWLAIVVCLVSLKTSVKKHWYTLHKRCFSIQYFTPLIRWFNYKSYVLYIPRSLFFADYWFFIFEEALFLSYRLSFLKSFLLWINLWDFQRVMLKLRSTFVSLFLF